MQKLHNFTWWLEPKKEKGSKSRKIEGKTKTQIKMKANKDT